MCQSVVILNFPEPFRPVNDIPAEQHLQPASEWNSDRWEMDWVLPSIDFFFASGIFESFELEHTINCCFMEFSYQFINMGQFYFLALRSIQFVGNMFRECVGSGKCFANVCEA